MEFCLGNEEEPEEEDVEERNEDGMELNVDDEGEEDVG